MPSLQQVGGYLYLNGNDVLSVLELTTELDAVDDYVSINSNPELCVPDLHWERISDSVSFSGNGECEVTERDCGREVGGLVTEDTTWSQVEGPVHVTSSLMVMDGVTLTIEPGVRVCMARNQGLTVRGGLVARGTADAPIEFTSAETYPEAGYWGSIDILSMADDAMVDDAGAYSGGVALEHVDVRYGGGDESTAAVRATNAAIFAQHLRIENSAQSGLSIIGESGDGTIPMSWIGNSDLSFNEGHGLYIDGYRLDGSVTVTSTDLSDNASSGISTGGGDSGGSHLFKFTDNTIQNNGGTGLWGGANGTQIITGNTVSSNGGHGIHTRGNGTYTISDNITQDNEGRGVYALYATHIVTNNIIERNGGGIKIGQGGEYTITNNTISSNTASDGAGVDTLEAWSPTVVVENNVITGNTCTDTNCGLVTVFEPSSGDPEFRLTNNDLSGNSVPYLVRSERTVSRRFVNATDNDWGTTDCSTLDALIYDFFDSSSLTIVDYGEAACDDTLPEAPACPGGTASISTPSDVLLYSSCTELDGVSLHMTSGVVDVTLPLLQIVRGSVYFHENVNVQAVNFPALEEVEGYVYFHNNDAIESIAMPSLADVGDYFYLNGNDVLSELELTDTLDTVGDYISISGSPLLCLPDLDWPSISDSVSISGVGDCDGSVVDTEPDCGREVGGLVVDDEVWSAAEGAVHLTSNIMVMDDASLTIEPGVRVCMSEGSGIVVRGDFMARGTESEPIVFGPDVEGVDSGYWSNISLTTTTPDALFDEAGGYVSGAIMEHVELSHGGGGDSVIGLVETHNVAVFFRDVTISESETNAIAINAETGEGTLPLTRIVASEFHDNGAHAVWIHGYGLDGSVEIHDCDIRDNGSAGISTAGGDSGGSHVFTFTDNRVIGNGGTGIWGGANGTQTITGNVVRDNGGNGIHTRGNGAYTIENNVVLDNGGVGIYGLYATHFIQTNTVSGNVRGIEIAQGGEYTIVGNTITENTASDGAAIHTLAAWSPAVWVEGNTIAGNTCTEVGCGVITIFDPESGDPEFRINENDLSGNTGDYLIWNERTVGTAAIDAANNYWGTEDTDAIDLSIHDFFDDPSVSVVEYTPILSEAP
jgi:hypothetical protein